MRETTMEDLPRIEKPGLGSWLFNPFAYVAGGTSLVIGLVAILISGVLASLSNSHYDGVLDFHSGGPPRPWLSIAEGFVDWISLAAALWIAGKVASKSRFRMIDVFGTQAMARWPVVFSALVMLLPPVQNFTRYLEWKVLRIGSEVAVQPIDGILFVASVIVMVLSLCWMVWLMYRGFSVSCNVKGWKAIVAFVVALFAAEVISKVVIVGLI
jgi:hypothetical protein